MDKDTILAVINSDMTAENKAAVIAALQQSAGGKVQSTGKAAQSVAVGTPTGKPYGSDPLPWFTDEDGYAGQDGPVGYRCPRCQALTRSEHRSRKHGRGGHRDATK